jgi:purine-nucleoside phosphorylase
MDGFTRVSGLRTGPGHGAAKNEASRNQGDEMIPIHPGSSMKNCSSRAIPNRDVHARKNLPEDSIIKPVKGKNTPDLGPAAVMVANELDLRCICRRMALEDQFRSLFMSRVYSRNQGFGSISVTGPLIGAPYAAMLLETLVAWGARKILFFGWCGSISRDVKIGDIIVPPCAMIDEGTSIHYQKEKQAETPASNYVNKKIREALRRHGFFFHEGAVWSTDAIFRETREKVEHFQQKNALAVEMELSALYTVGRFLGVDIGAILVVSDELSTLKWRHGFKDERFKQSRQAACEVISGLCEEL